MPNGSVTVHTGDTPSANAATFTQKTINQGTLAGNTGNFDTVKVLVQR